MDMARLRNLDALLLAQAYAGEVVEGDDAPLGEDLEAWLDAILDEEWDD